MELLLFLTPFFPSTFPDTIIAAQCNFSSLLYNTFKSSSLVFWCFRCRCRRHQSLCTPMCSFFVAAHFIALLPLLCFCAAFSFGRAAHLMAFKHAMHNMYEGKALAQPAWACVRTYRHRMHKYVYGTECFFHVVFLFFLCFVLFFGFAANKLCRIQI